MANTCPTVLKFCVVRATRLDEVTGEVVGGADGGYVSNGVISLEMSAEIDEGSESTMKNGCGAILASNRNPDRFKRWNLTLTMGQFEPGLFEILTGNTVVMDGGDIVGIKGVDQQDPDFTESLAAIEGWGFAQEGDAPDPIRPYIYLVIPATFWQIGDWTFQEELMEMPLTGFSRTNSSWGSGPYGDDTGLSELVSTWMIAAVDQAPPTADCGYIAVTPGS